MKKVEIKDIQRLGKEHMKKIGGGANCFAVAVCSDGTTLYGIFDCSDFDGGDGGDACEAWGGGDSTSCDCLDGGPPAY